MGFLSAVVGIEKADGSRADAPRADGTRAPIMIRLGDGLLAGESTENGGTTRVPIVADPAYIAAIAASSSGAFDALNERVHAAVETIGFLKSIPEDELVHGMLVAVADDDEGNPFVAFFDDTEGAGVDGDDINSFRPTARLEAAAGRFYRLPQLATGSRRGMISATDFTKLAGLPSSAVPTTRQVISGGGLTGGGDLSADRTLAVGQGDDIQVNADTVAVITATTATADRILKRGAAAEAVAARFDANYGAAGYRLKNNAGTLQNALQSGIDGTDFLSLGGAAGLWSVVEIWGGSTGCRIDTPGILVCNPTAAGYLQNNGTTKGYWDALGVHLVSLLIGAAAPVGARNLLWDQFAATGISSTTVVHTVTPSANTGRLLVVFGIARDTAAPARVHAWVKVLRVERFGAGTVIGTPASVLDEQSVGGAGWVFDFNLSGNDVQLRHNPQGVTVDVDLYVIDILL